jgi:hypothetical protein
VDAAVLGVALEGSLRAGVRVAHLRAVRPENTEASAIAAVSREWARSHRRSVPGRSSLSSMLVSGILMLFDTRMWRKLPLEHSA